MPRISLNRTLRDLKATGVRRFRFRDGSEVEFFEAGGEPVAVEAQDRETARDTKRPPLKDPIAAALKDDLLDGEAEAN
jgi:hypothetical protein